MANLTTCPPIQDLQRLLLGQVDDPEAVDLERHFTQCDRCLETAVSLPPDDALVETMRSGPPPVPREEGDASAIAGLIQQLKELPAANLAGEGSPALIPEIMDPATADIPLAPHVPQEGLGAEVYDFLAPPQGPDELGRLGHYRVLQVLGAGGMGVVFQAEDLQLRRRVALKAMRPALAASASARARFLREARATAALQHDHIITIHQVGQDRDIPFFAMQLLQGESLADRLKRQLTLPIPEVLRIGREIAEGLLAAHERGLVHRDIKPANIFLEAASGNRQSALGQTQDSDSPKPIADSRVKILDFGLAWSVAEELELTQTGVVIGTPQFMAPEQADGRTVTPRCDLYSLGCILYRMCTGKAPWQIQARAGMIVSLEPKDLPPARELNPATPPELSDLIAKLLTRDPAQRSQSAAVVVEALGAIERSRAIPVRPAPCSTDSAVRHVRPAKRRLRPIPAAVAAMLLFALGLAVYQVGPATVIRIATNQGELVIETDDENVQVIVKKDGARIIDPTSRREIDLKVGAYEIELAEAKEGLQLSTKAFTMTRGGRMVVKVTLEPRSADKVTAPPAKEASPPARPLDSLNPTLIPAEERQPWHPKELVAVLGNSRLKHWSGVFSVAFSPDGNTLASGSADATVQLWDPATGKSRHLLRGHTDVVTSLAFSRDGKLLASASRDAKIKLWDPATGKVVRTLPAQGGQVLAVAFGNGNHMASASDQTVTLWELNQEPDRIRKSRTLKGHQGAVQALAFSKDGLVLASGSADNTVKLWDPATGTELHTFSGHTGQVISVAFNPDGTLLASAGHDGTVKVWDVMAKKQVHTLKSGTGKVYSVGFSSSGRTLAACDDGPQHLVKFWDAATGKALPSLRAGVGLNLCLAFNPDGRTLALGNNNSYAVHLLDLSTQELLAFPPGHHGVVRTLAFSPDDQILASGGLDRTLRLWHTTTGKEKAIFQDRASIASLNSLAFSPDRCELASTNAHSVMLWDWGSGKEKRTLKGHTHYVDAVAYSPDGKRLASASSDGTVKLWDPAEGQELRTFQGHTGKVKAVAFSPDGQTLASAAIVDDKQGRWLLSEVILWDTATGQNLRTLQEPKNAVYSLAFSPDGRTLALAISGQKGQSIVKILDLTTGKERHTLKSNGRRLSSVVFRPDGKVLAAAADDGTVQLWDTQTGQIKAQFQLGPPGSHVEILQVVFNRDGRYLASANGNGTIYILRLDAQKELASQ